MSHLCNLELTENEILEITSKYELDYIFDEEIEIKIELLSKLNLDNKQIKHIILTNPWFLDKCISDIIKTINKLKEIGINNLDSLVYTNPFILSVDSFEIDSFILKKNNEGYQFNDIIELIKEDSTLITEQE